MSTLITLQAAELAFGDLPLLDKADLVIQEGERIGLIGRNGTGKSSLLKVIAGIDRLDDGKKTIKDGLRIEYVEQEPALPKADTLLQSLLFRAQFDESTDERQKWQFLARLEEYLHRFNLNGNSRPDSVSGGERKRAALALAFARENDLLLLDETLKEEQLQIEQTERRKFDKFWAQEEVWIRKGIEARRTRNEGRVRRLERLREERAARRESIGQINLNIDAGTKSGKIVAELENVNLSFGEKTIVRNLNFRLLRGDRLGLIGHNGIGKSTLISLILGKRQPDSGSVKLGTNLQIAYFDQLRAQLDPNKTVAETISPGSEWIEVGNAKKHIMAYLADFLFPPRRANVPVANLSGGERNRLLLARLFALPANLLVLDEPTNDLDIDSLELLEQTLQNYPGTLILVSHDRRFLDNVVTEVLAPEGEGIWREYVGGYSDWLRYRPLPKEEPKTVVQTKIIHKRAKPEKIRLSFKENKELNELPERLISLEQTRDALLAQMNESDYFSRCTPEEIKNNADKLESLQIKIDEGYQRWEFLETKRMQSEQK